MKKHTTVTITRAILESHYPCSRGLENALPFLPATLSTDPEANIALACALAETPRAVETAFAIVHMKRHDVYWLACTIAEEFGYPDPDYHRYDKGSLGDPMLGAQWLAMVADRIATKKGK